MDLTRAQRRKLWVDAARRDKNAFIEYCFRDKNNKPLRQGAVHEHWQAALSKHQHVMIGGSRDHGKSTNAIGALLWELGHNPDETFTIIGANESKANKRVREVRTHIERNERVQEVFPRLKLEASSASQLMVKRRSISKNASVEGYGVLGAGTGDRSGVILFDDVVDRRNALTIPAMRKAVKDAYYNDWINLLPPDGRSWYLFNPWHKDDLSHELMAKSDMPCVKSFVKADWNEDGTIKKLHPVWPEKWGVRALLARLKRITMRAFRRGFLGEAMSDDEKLFSYDWFDFKWPTFKLTEAVRIQTWDGAAPYQTQSDDPDYVAMVDGYVSPMHGRAFIANAAHWQRLSLSQQVDEVVRAANTGPPPTYVMIEQHGESALCAEVCQAINRLPPSTEVIPFRSRGQSKPVRAQGVTKVCEDGRVLVAPALDPNQHEDCVPLLDELTDFPFSAHDDLVDAFVMFLVLARAVANFELVGDEMSDDDLESQVMVY